MKTEAEEIEQIRAQFGLLTKEVSAYKQMLEDFLKSQGTQKNRANNAKILVKVNGRFIIIQTGDICWIEACGDYIRLHCSSKSFFIHQKIGDMEKKLDPYLFFRVNKSAIINMDYIKEMEPMNHGDYLITLRDNTQLNLSRNYRNCLSTMFGQHI